MAAGEHVRVVTDVDCDGVTSCLILQATRATTLNPTPIHITRVSRAPLQATLRHAGVERLSFELASRQKEGYGFSPAAADRAIKDGVGVVVTGDIGLSDHAAIAKCRAGGVDVIVCDHHLPQGGQVPPDAHAVLSPVQQLCSYPNPALAACRISLKLAQHLLRDREPAYRRQVYL